MRSYQQSERSSQVQKKAEMRPVIKVEHGSGPGKTGKTGNSPVLKGLRYLTCYHSGAGLAKLFRGHDSKWSQPGV